MKLKVSIVIPTYNEKENIEKICGAINKTLKENKINGEIVVVDDNSPDGTAKIVKKISKKYNIRLIERKKKLGLGSAYKVGFKAARGDILFEMDADFSHDPKYIPDFVKKVNQGYDVVIGSRYIAGGERKDPLHRRIFPLIGNFIYQRILGSSITDTTSGYRAYRKSVLKKIDFKKLPDDFSFQAAISFALLAKKARITEIPIEFRERAAGEPKYGFQDLLGNIKFLLKIMFKRY